MPHHLPPRITQVKFVPLGKSDHVCQKWKLVVSEIMFKNTTRRRPNFKRADWSAIKEALQEYRNDPQDSPDTMAGKLFSKIEELKTKHIPYCKPKGDKHRLPWMKSSKVKKQRAMKWRSWKLFKIMKQSAKCPNVETLTFKLMKVLDLSFLITVCRSLNWKKVNVRL